MEPRDLFKRLEAQYGLPDYLDGAWAIESGRGRHLLNRSTGAAGHFQFMPGTAKQYGLSDPNDLRASADAAARLARDAAARLNKIGAPVNAGNLYLVHQQGAGGASALLRNPDRPAVDVLAEVYGSANTASRAITLNGGNLSWTAGEFANHIASAYYTKAGKKPPAPAQTAAARAASPATNRESDRGFVLPDVIQAAASSASDAWSDLVATLTSRQNPSKSQPATSNPFDMIGQTQQSRAAGFGDAILSLLN